MFNAWREAVFPDDGVKLGKLKTTLSLQKMTSLQKMRTLKNMRTVQKATKTKPVNDNGDRYLDDVSRTVETHFMSQLSDDVVSRMNNAGAVFSDRLPWTVMTRILVQSRLFCTIGEAFKKVQADFITFRDSFKQTHCVPEACENEIFRVWLNPLTYLWKMFEFGIEDRDKYAENYFSILDCAQVIRRCVGEDFKTIKVDKPSESRPWYTLRLPFGYTDTSNTELFELPVPGRTFHWLLKRGYGVAQIAGFMLLHLRRVFYLAESTIHCNAKMVLAHLCDRNADLLSLMVHALMTSDPSLSILSTQNSKCVPFLMSYLPYINEKTRGLLTVCHKRRQKLRQEVRKCANVYDFAPWHVAFIFDYYGLSQNEYARDVLEHVSTGSRMLWEIVSLVRLFGERKWDRVVEAKVAQEFASNVFRRRNTPERSLDGKTFLRSDLDELKRLTATTAAHICAQVSTVMGAKSNEQTAMTDCIMYKLLVYCFRNAGPTFMEVLKVNLSTVYTEGHIKDLIDTVAWVVQRYRFSVIDGGEVLTNHHIAMNPFCISLMNPRIPKIINRFTHRFQMLTLVWESVQKIRTFWLNTDRQHFNVRLFSQTTGRPLSGFPVPTDTTYFEGSQSVSLAEILSDKEGYHELPTASTFCVVEQLALTMFGSKETFFRQRESFIQFTDSAFFVTNTFARKLTCFLLVKLCQELMWFVHAFHIGVLKLNQKKRGSTKDPVIQASELSALKEISIETKIFCCFWRDMWKSVQEVASDKLVTPISREFLETFKEFSDCPEVNWDWLSDVDQPFHKLAMLTACYA